MARKPRLILHIGTMKTGSTAIQRFFALNRRALPLFGLHYPRALDGRALNHNDLAESAGSAAAGAARDAYLGAAARRRRCATLLSAERLAALGPAGAAGFAAAAEAFEMRVIVWLRRQDEWALSTYREHIMRPDIAEARPLRTWLEAPEIRAQMEYAALLEAWADVVGRAAIRVLRYPQDLPLLPHFLDAADLPKALMALPFHGKRVKESVSDTVLLAQMAANGGQPERPALSQEERDALLADLRPGNARIRAAYRPDVDRLFGMQ